MRHARASGGGVPHKSEWSSGETRVYLTGVKLSLL
jgi:hypothetical protein